MLAGEGVFVQHSIRAAFHGLGLHAALAAVGIKGDGDLFGLAVLHPHVLFSVIDIGVACNGVRGVSVGMCCAAVFQEGRVDRDGVRSYIAAALGHLIGVCLGAGAIDHDDLAGLAGGDDACAAGGSEQEATGLDGAVDVHDHILQVGLCPVIGPAGRIAQGHEAIAGMDIFQAVHTVQVTVIAVGPLVRVVNEQVVAPAGFNGFAGGVGIGDIQCCPFRHTQAGTGQQGQILIQGSCAGEDVDVDIAVDGQNKFGRINIDSCYGKLNGRERRVAPHIDPQPVGGADVGLGDAAARLGLEHGSLTHEFHGSGKDHFAHVERGVDIFLRAALIGNGRFHILHIVLAQGERKVSKVASNQGSGSTAAAEVPDLEVFIDRRAGLGSDGTAAGNKAPGIEGRAAVQGNVGAGRHVHKAARPGGAACISCGTARGMLGAEADGAVYGDVRVRRQGQGTVGRGLYPSHIIK